jgi:hypothetical protein
VDTQYVVWISGAALGIVNGHRSVAWTGRPERNLMPTSPAPTRTVTELVDEHLATWSEPDAERRLQRIAECWEADGALIDPPLQGQGHDGISALMAAMQEHYPDHAFARCSAVDAHHDTFRVAWELRGPTGDAALGGLDVGVISADNKLLRISGFFGDTPVEASK